MAWVRTMAPAALAVTLDDAREKVRATTDDGLDNQITLALQGLIAVTEHLTGQCFIEQGWRVTLDAFPLACGDEPVVRLPHPLRAVQSVTYTDANGAQQTLAPSAYDVVVEQYRSFIAPKAASWPATASVPRAVSVQCTAGYGTDATATPAEARQYILARLELEFCPPLHPPTLEQLERILAPLTVWG